VRKLATVVGQRCLLKRLSLFGFIRDFFGTFLVGVFARAAEVLIAAPVGFWKRDCVSQESDAFFTRGSWEGALRRVTTVSWSLMFCFLFQDRGDNNRGRGGRGGRN
jgi:hypothetical protein